MKRPLSLYIHSDSVFINKLAAQQSGSGDQSRGDRRYIQPPRQQKSGGIVDPQEPIKRSEGEQHNGDNGVAPTGDETPYSGDRNQIDKTDKPRYPSSKSPDSGQPKARTRPEKIPRKNIPQIGGNQTEQGRHGQVNHHRMQRVPFDRHSTDNRLVGHDGFSKIGVRGKKPAIAVPISIVTAALGGCEGQASILQPAGESARLIVWLWWGMFSWFSLVLFVVVGLWIWALFRKGPVLDAQGERRVSKRWIIGGGVILPLVSVTVLLLFAIPMGHRVLVLAPADQPLMPIEVKAHRFWWEVNYPGTGVITANQLQLPVDVPIEFQLTTDDVIHSFWIPRLGPKLDVVPGRNERLRLRASETGVMRGHCAEYCGRGHAHMVIAVEVVEQEAFDAWIERRQQPIIVAEEHEEGAVAFQDSCGGCHRVAGVTDGARAPDLSDIGARRLLGAEVKQQPVTIEQWMRLGGVVPLNAETPDHSRMVPDDQIEKIATWLETLGR